VYFTLGQPHQGVRACPDAVYTAPKPLVLVSGTIALVSSILRRVRWLYPGDNFNDVSRSVWTVVRGEVFSFMPGPQPLNSVSYDTLRTRTPRFQRQMFCDVGRLYRHDIAGSPLNGSTIAGHRVHGAVSSNSILVSIPCAEKGFSGGTFSLIRGLV
jgi:hypothetical protein